VETVCVQWPRLGPYHIARLRAAHRLFAERGVRLVALETAEADETYGWRTHTESESFGWERVFAGRSHETIGAREMEAGVRAALDQLDPSAVAITSYSHPDARACLAWCRRHRRTAVLMSDSKADDAPRVAWRESVKSIIVRQYDAALVAGTPHAAYLAGLGFPPDLIFRPVDVIDNDRFAVGATRARRDAERSASIVGVAAGTPYFLGVSRFIARKNLDTLIAAYGAYRRSAAASGQRPWPLVLIGDGPDIERLRRLAADVAEDAVLFPGFRQVDELVAFYGLAGCFVHPAAADQWGLVVNEAMAAGLPVVVSRVAGCARDLVQDGVNGFTFDPGSIDELAGLLARLAAMSDDERTEMGSAGQRTISRYRPEDFAEGLERAIRAGAIRRDRGLPAPATLALTALRWLARDTRAFHSIPD
jgi:glycosyltransferase involved in cell wall biosynthesis